MFLNPFKNMGLYKKNILALVMFTVTIISFSMAMFISISFPQFKNLISVFNDLIEQSNIITLAIHDHDKAAIDTAISQIRSDPTVLNVEFYSVENGRMIKTSTDQSKDQEIKKSAISNNHAINLIIPFREKDKAVGVLQVKFSSRKMDVESLIKISILIILISIYISKVLTDSILTPLLSLAETAEKIKTNNDYSLRAIKYNHDEVGMLVDSFTAMLSSVQTYTKQQRAFHDHAENMASTMKSIIDHHDYSIRIHNGDASKDEIIQTLSVSFNNMLEEIQQYQKKLSLSERQAGMSDVTINILHTVGNVLNSAKISAGIIQEKIMESEIAKLARVIQLLKDHENDLSQFLTQNSKGKQVTDYLSVLFNAWEKEKKDTNSEVDRLQENIEKIQNILNIQNAVLDKTIDVSQKINISEIIEDAIAAQKNKIQADIEITRDFTSLPDAVMDRVKLLQILIHLIENSVNLLETIDSEQKKIIIALIAKNDKHFLISIKNNGRDLSPGEIAAIFNPDFNAQEKSFISALHRAALFALELHGQLNIANNTPEKGVTFTLELPY